MTIYREGALIGMEHLLGRSTYWDQELTGMNIYWNEVLYLLGWNPYRDKVFTGMEPLLYTGMEPLQG